jgi:tRNA pseudouridine38-40 synthase
MDLAYRGDPFRGWAANPGVATVEGLLTDALTTVLRQPVRLAVAGRTDAGVHAAHQVVSFDVAGDVDLGALQATVNRLCGPHVVVTSAAVADPDFHARFSARARRYRYRLLRAGVPDPFRAETTWWVPEPLDEAAMAAGADELVGEHDFASFCRRPKHQPEASLFRRVTEASWSRRPDDELWFEIEADSFCHQMVRSVVGLLVDVGRGRRPTAAVGEVLRAADRAVHRADLAPPGGLVLIDVRY